MSVFACTASYTNTHTHTHTPTHSHTHTPCYWMHPCISMRGYVRLFVHQAFSKTWRKHLGLTADHIRMDGGISWGSFHANTHWELLRLSSFFIRITSCEIFFLFIHTHTNTHTHTHRHSSFFWGFEQTMQKSSVHGHFKLFSFLWYHSTHSN